MNIALADAFAPTTAETLILPLFADRPAPLSGPLETLAKTPGLGEASAKFKETGILYTLPGAPCRRLLTVGMGDAAEFSLDKLSRALAVAARVARDRLCERAGVLLAGLPEVESASAPRIVREATVALCLGLYAFKLLKTTDESPADPKEFLLMPDKNASREELSAALALGLAEAEGVCLARDLVNRPSNHASPAIVAETARELAARHGFSCRVHGRQEIEAMGMGAFAAVAQGSRAEPAFIVLDTDPDGGKPLVLIGKGVTFDTGGISLKPAAKMEEMKSDMAGAAAVLGCLETLGRLGGGRGASRVIGLLPCTDNMPDGGSVKPGDVVESLAGLTVEIVNTDAEGRLLLADALAFAARLSPSTIIDAATLTGACRIALGVHYAGVFSPSDEFAERIRVTGAGVGDRFWRLPLDELFAEELKSDTADLKNVGRREGGAITAAMFLKRFVPEGASWAHLDIAPTSFVDAASDLWPKGATGFGVRTLAALARGQD